MDSPDHLNVFPENNRNSIDVLKNWANIRLDGKFYFYFQIIHRYDANL